jgi:hypothetical protein
MLYYLWLYSFFAPYVAADIIFRTSPFFPGGAAWPLGFDSLARDY